MFMSKTIFRNLLKKYSTRLHPQEEHILPDGFRGRFKFAIDKCILCRACVVKCPTKVIRIDPDLGLWEREVMGCLYCGVCADVCPTGCIIMTNVYRPPITEPATLRFNVKPRPSKKKAKVADDLPSEKEIQAAIEQKVADDARDGNSSEGKHETVEEEAVIPASQARTAMAVTTAATTEAAAPAALEVVSEAPGQAPSQGVTEAAKEAAREAGPSGDVLVGPDGEAVPSPTASTPQSASEAAKAEEEAAGEAAGPEAAKPAPGSKPGKGKKKR